MVPGLGNGLRPGNSAGLRLNELLRLRIKDADLERRQILVRGGKGDKDRVTVLPESVVGRLHAHLERLRQPHEADLAAGLPGVWAPEALEHRLDQRHPETLPHAGRRGS